MQFNASKYDLPPIYKHQGKDCYLDPIRKRLIFITPEETVRQRLLAYFVEALHVPIEMLGVEERLSHYGVKSSRRADIIIHQLNNDKLMVPVAIIECKAPGIILGNNAENQVADYCDSLGCNYAMLVTDVECFCFYYDEKIKTYKQIEGFPEYTDMVNGQYVAHNLAKIPERVPFNEISDVLKNSLNESSCDISCQTEHGLACALFNLWDGLLDERHKMPGKEYTLFKLIQDYGVRMLSYGNAAGGDFSGLYRSFLIEFKGSTGFVSLGISTYCTYEKPDQMKTALNVAIDNENNSHLALQLVADNNVTVHGNKYKFCHHGRIGVGNIGSGKVDDLREVIRSRYPKIIEGNHFSLGSLVYDHLWALDEPDTIELIENLISYALLRDEYRKILKQRN